MNLTVDDSRVPNIAQEKHKKIALQHFYHNAETTEPHKRTLASAPSALPTAKSNKRSVFSAQAFRLFKSPDIIHCLSENILR